MKELNKTINKRKEWMEWLKKGYTIERGNARVNGLKWLIERWMECIELLS